MKVAFEVFALWKTNYEHGDINHICDESGYSRPTISTALKTGECSEDVLKSINEFYAAKAKLKKEHEKEVADEMMSQFKD